jgi:hypothetical protein
MYSAWTESVKGKIEGAGRNKQLLDNLRETGKYRKFNEIALVCSLWRTHFGRGYESVT